MKTLPAGALFSVDTADFGEFCDFAVGWNLDHQLIGRQRARIGVSGFITPSLQLAFVQQTGDCCWQGTSPSGSVTLQVSLGGSAGTTHCGRSIEPLQMAISRSSEPFELLAQSGASHLVASFSQAKVEQYAADVWHEPRLLRDPSGRLQFPGMTHRQRYVDACQQAIRDVQKEPKLLSDSRCASVLQEKLLENLVLQGCANALYPSDRSRYKVARRAYRYLLESLEDVPSISSFVRSLQPITRLCNGAIGKPMACRRRRTSRLCGSLARNETCASRPRAPRSQALRCAGDFWSWAALPCSIENVSENRRVRPCGKLEVLPVDSAQRQLRRKSDKPRQH